MKWVKEKENKSYIVQVYVKHSLFNNDINR